MSNQLSQEIKSLSKGEIHERLGATFNARVLKFCHECSTKGLIDWVKYHEKRHGSFINGIKALAEKYPTEDIVSYHDDGFDIRFTLCGDRVLVPKVYALKTVEPSLWVKWLRCLELAEEVYQ